MSVTMHLYKVLDNVDFLGNVCDKVKWTESDESALFEYEINHGYREDMSEDELDDWYNKMGALAYSDGIKHDLFDLSYIKRIFYKDKAFRRVLKTLRDFKFKKYTNANSDVYNYVVVDEVAYRQGWFFKNRFFRKKTTMVVCTTKKQLETFIKKYIDMHDNYGVEAAKTFLDTFEPGMIFECAW